MTVSPTAAGARHRSLMSARAAAPVAMVALLALTAVTGCDKPRPGVTVFSGTHSANRAAICWSPDADRPVTSDDCSLQFNAADDDFDKRLLEQVAIIPTAPGQTVGISVDPSVAEGGWLATINGRALTRGTITDKYFRFTMPPQPLRRGDAQLVIQAATADGDGVRGAWLFGLTDSA